MYFRKSAVVAVFSTWALTAAASAVVVNVDFGMHGDHPSGAVSKLYVGTAAAPDAGTVWNELQVQDNNAFDGAPGEFGLWTSSVTVSNLKNSTGGTTPLSVTAVAHPADTGAFGCVDGSPNIQCVATDAVDLMRDYLIGFNDPKTVSIAGFTPGTSVTLYLYGAGDTSNRDTVFTVTDVNGVHSATTTGTISNDGNFPVAHTLTLGGDYVVLSGLIADSLGNLSITYDNGAGSNEAPFNGLQAVYAIPEPGALGLLGVTALAIARRRR